MKEIILRLCIKKNDERYYKKQSRLVFYSLLALILNIIISLIFGFSDCEYTMIGFILLLLFLIIMIINGVKKDNYNKFLIKKIKNKIIIDKNINKNIYKD